MLYSWVEVIVAFLNTQQYKLNGKLNLIHCNYMGYHTVWISIHFTLT